MGKNDIRMKRWLSDKRRFASLVNGGLFGQTQVFSEESLHQEEREQAVVLKKAGGNDVAVDKYRDISMRAEDGTRIVVLACENQEEVHYAMVVRNMLYDALNYAEQVQQIRKKRRKNQKNKDSGEFLSGMGKNDLLCPVLTVIFYYGDNEEGWDAHTDLHGLTGINREEYKLLQNVIPNYSIHVIDPGKIEDLSCFEQDLQMVFGMLKYRKDKEQLKNYIQENKAYFEHIDEESYDAAVAMLGAGKMMDHQKEKESGGRNMCKAIDDIYNDGIATGKAEDILELLRTVGEVSDNLREIIYAQRDLQTLNAWFRTAVRVDSIAEFESVVGGGRAVLRKM